jgi:hypothetical protein
MCEGERKAQTLAKHCQRNFSKCAAPVEERSGAFYDPNSGNPIAS